MALVVSALASVGLAGPAVLRGVIPRASARARPCCLCAPLQRLHDRVRNNPSDPQAHFELGAAHMSRGQASDAAACLRRSLELRAAPDVMDALHDVACVLMDEREFAAAEQCWIHSLGIDPDNLGVRERLAATLRSAGRLLEAAQVLHGMLPRLEGRAERCGVLLDLGGLIDEIAPIPGVGPEWVDPTSSLPASPRVRLGSGEAVEPLSAEACYRRAAEADPECGEAHKRLADVLVLVAGEAAALPSFERAAALMPDDVCCATHVYCGAPPPRARTALPLVETPEEPHATLATLTGRVPGCYGAMAASFELHGALVIPSLLSAADVDSLRAAVDAASDDARTLDFTSETRDAERREHKALPLAHARTAATLGAACRALWPVLAEALQVEAAGCVPLLGAGFMKVRPGAAAQRLHKDVHLHDRHGGVGRLAAGGAPRAMSVQLQLTDTTAERRMGALELLPGSHRPDGAHGRPDQIERAVRDAADAPEIVPVSVTAGAVTLYSSRLWHCGGANDSETERVFIFLTLAEPGTAAPPGLIHTMAREDVGGWVVCAEGLTPATS